MLCDKCAKKRVCKLYDGSNIQGCIEFYRPHEKVLQEIKQEIHHLHEWAFTREEIEKILNKHIKQIEESGAE